MRREKSVAGSFYPKEEKELKRYFDHFNKLYEKNLKFPEVESKAIIVPHAGYIYSGYTANIAYRVLQNSKVKNFLVIGPSHRVSFQGISICKAHSYDTPFGEIKSAQKILNNLKEKFKLLSIKEAHREHSTEVQFPFIKYYLKGANIVELVYSDTSSDQISEIIDYTLSQEDCGVIISTDLSHFYTLEVANKLDNICSSAIEKLDIELLNNGCEACGKLGVEAMIKSAIKMGMSSSILDYRTSADASDDKQRVVGYLSAYFI
jgi:MEMO1 family protein